MYSSYDYALPYRPKPFERLLNMACNGIATESYQTAIRRLGSSWGVTDAVPTDDDET
jgi:hypothetical protein